MRDGVTVTVLRPEPPRSTRVVDTPTYVVPSELEIATRMFAEFRRKVLAEARELRAYAEDSDVDEVRRAFTATADRLVEIVGDVA